MEKYLGTKNYIKKQDAKFNLIISLVSWLFILFGIFYQPDLTFEKDRDFVHLKGDKIKSYMIFDKGEGFKVYENDISYSPDAKLRPIVGNLFNKNKIIVDDEKGNRFAILVNDISAYPKGLRILNHSFRYIYNRKDLNGELLSDIISKAGDYSFLDKDKRIMVFPQIVLFNGAERTKGVALIYDENGRVTQTGIWDSPHTNLYTHIPYYDKIASWNLFLKFQRFTQENNYEPEFFGENISSICWFAIDLLLCPLMIIIVLGSMFYALYPLLYCLCKIPKVPNILIGLTAYSTTPVMLVYSLAILYHFNNIWIWAAISAITYLGFTISFIFSFMPSSVRCNKCHSMNCIDVVETEYLYNKDVISEVGSTRKVGEYEPQEWASEKLYIRTHYYEKCTLCGNVHEYDTKSTKMEKKKRISEIDCPKCGKYTLEVGSQLVKNDLNTTRWSSTKEGKLKNVGNIIDGPEYKKEDVINHYYRISGTLTYKLICKCKNCDYEYSKMHEEYIRGEKNYEGSDAIIYTYKKK